MIVIVAQGCYPPNPSPTTRIDLRTTNLYKVHYKWDHGGVSIYLIFIIHAHNRSILPSNLVIIITRRDWFVKGEGKFGSISHIAAHFVFCAYMFFYRSSFFSLVGINHSNVIRNMPPGSSSISYLFGVVSIL